MVRRLDRDRRVRDACTIEAGQDPPSGLAVAELGPKEPYCVHAT